jgi:hypothetical protein
MLGPTPTENFVPAKSHLTGHRRSTAHRALAPNFVTSNASALNCWRVPPDEVRGLAAADPAVREDRGLDIHAQAFRSMGRIQVAVSCRSQIARLSAESPRKLGQRREARGEGGRSRRNLIPGQAENRAVAGRMRVRGRYSSRRCPDDCANGSDWSFRSRARCAGSHLLGEDQGQTLVRKVRAGRSCQEPAQTSLAHNHVTARLSYKVPTHNQTLRQTRPAGFRSARQWAITGPPGPTPHSKKCLIY